jgi:hypothetical protein
MQPLLSFAKIAHLEPTAEVIDVYTALTEQPRLAESRAPKTARPALWASTAPRPLLEAAALVPLDSLLLLMDHLAPPA